MFTCYNRIYFETKSYMHRPIQGPIFCYPDVMLLEQQGNHEEKRNKGDNFMPASSSASHVHSGASDLGLCYCRIWLEMLIKEFAYTKQRNISRTKRDGFYLRAAVLGNLPV